MKKEDWEKAKSRLRAPLGQVDLLCDGYSVTLVNECISMFRNGIAVYVNGKYAVHGLCRIARSAGGLSLKKKLP